MNRLVLDASVAQRWFMAQPEPYAERVRQALLRRAWTAVVPWLWHWEIANGIAVQERRRLLNASGTDATWQLVRRWSEAIEVDEAPSRPFTRAFELARRYQLSAYDAAYLELALRLDAPLATLDAALRQAARAVGVAVDF